MIEILSRIKKIVKIHGEEKIFRETKEIFKNSETLITWLAEIDVKTKRHYETLRQRNK